MRDYMEQLFSIEKEMKDPEYCGQKCVLCGGATNHCTERHVMEIRTLQHENAILINALWKIAPWLSVSLHELKLVNDGKYEAACNKVFEALEQIES